MYAETHAPRFFFVSLLVLSCVACLMLILTGLSCQRMHRRAKRVWWEMIRGWMFMRVCWHWAGMRLRCSQQTRDLKVCFVMGSAEIW